jgi:hypothetical protein
MEKTTLGNQVLVPDLENYSYVILQGKCEATRIDGTTAEARKMRMIGTCTEYHHLLLKSRWTASAATELGKIPNIVLYSLFSDAPETIQQLRLAMEGKVAAQNRAEQQAIEVSATV